MDDAAPSQHPILNRERVWERVPARGPLVYWRMQLAHVRAGGRAYLAVSRSAQGWTWALHGPEFRRGSGYQIHDQGVSGSVAGAKAAAVRTVLDPHCPNCGAGLDTGSADIFHCPACGDEWHPMTWPYYLPTTHAADTYSGS